MKLFCPNGHLLCEFEVSPSGEIQAKDFCGISVTINNINEIHLIGCSDCAKKSTNPFEGKKKPAA